MDLRQENLALSIVWGGDVKEICSDVLRHRILLSWEAEAEGVSTDWLISQILQRIHTP